MGWHAALTSEEQVARLARNAQHREDAQQVAPLPVDVADDVDGNVGDLDEARVVLLELELGMQAQGGQLVPMVLDLNEWWLDC